MTLRTYAETVGELTDRRTQKKAQTRELIRTIAHRLFDEQGFEAVTIADVARQADVAVQTVFNHFATKEELFFDGRATWVDGPADAVRSRAAEVPPLTALREYLVELSGWLVGSLIVEERQRYTATLMASPSLRAHERELIHETEVRLAAALTEAWAGENAGGHPVPADPVTAASLTAAIWCSAVRVLVQEQRPRFAAGECPRKLSTAVEALVAELLASLELSASVTDRLLDQTGEAPATRTGWPHVAAQAG
jgi:AcrR family transcriptional regulator